MLKIDSNRLAAIEHEIEKKFGKDAIRHPRADWDEIKEKEFIEQTTELNRKLEQLIDEKSYINKNGYLVSKKLLNDDRDKKQDCPYCEKYHFHFNVADDINMNKYGCCRECYYKYIDRREERWNEGWRPEKINK